LRQVSSSEEYANEDEYPDEYIESDDPDLYNDEEDDLLLHDEDFPSDGDVNILDEDFPHENHLRYEDQMQHHRRSFEPPPPMKSSPVPTNDQKYLNRHPLESPPSCSPDYLQDPVPQLDLHHHQQDSNDFTPQLEDCLFFDPNTIESFIKFHRAQIREVTEYSKKETKLLANFSLGLSSRRDGDRQTSIRDELKTSSEFIGYLDNLDEVLEMKTAAIEALRDRIRHVLGEEEL
jgi:hypothetical protein